MEKSFTRMDRVNEQLRTLIAEHLPLVIELPSSIIVSIIKVEASRDLAHANVFVMVYPDGSADKALLACNKAMHALVHFVSEHTKLYKVPKLFFRLDQTEQRASKIDALLDSLQHKDT